MQASLSSPPESATRPELEVKGLKTQFATRAGVVKAVDGVDMYLRHGEILGLVGESGSGKSITGFSLIGLLDEPGRVVEGEIRFDGEDLRQAAPARWRALRGDAMAMIFQDPMMTLNPVLRVDTQMVETVLAHRRVSRGEAYQRALQVLTMVGIPAPRERLRAYPHQLSGGMRQRVAIAIALLNSPRLIIADEPTTALDVTIQGQILYEMRKLCEETGTALIWITHDLAVVAGLADRVAVMYAGRIVETGSAADVIEHAMHPYTHGLIASIPTPDTRGKPLDQIPGMTPSLLNLPAGCAFRTRCPRASQACLQAPEPVEVRPAHWVRCWHAGEA
ncbi:oligopeptide/dipeptide transporter, C-terminal domain protein [Bordetella bronchiseptica MBORD681]|uniref:ABC transporter ATP-binding protein n=1 Tax=Bordetella bronchiseptica TaxID=518 RepID=UPI000460EC79|nr:ABC transporter ATP-binding protein [Bordetella bronchiseptica]KDD04981.1 oligopeptide/dipeptide transporter, C-terminal domain protein [Bordetella bronchiseptica MBORD681]KDD08487.1 oligopeptide/dipeptide transporter, C-terminal domain protein [Bordetella bronchiseptica MBORD698]